jgi:hypothetical protein
MYQMSYPENVDFSRDDRTTDNLVTSTAGAPLALVEVLRARPDYARQAVLRVLGTSGRATAFLERRRHAR